MVLGQAVPSARLLAAPRAVPCCQYPVQSLGVLCHVVPEAVLRGERACFLSDPPRLPRPTRICDARPAVSTGPIGPDGRPPPQHPNCRPFAIASLPCGAGERLFIPRPTPQSCVRRVPTALLAPHAPHACTHACTHAMAASYAPTTRPTPHSPSPGVCFFNRTAPAEALLRAWAEVMAHPNNSRAPDDQTLDLLVNSDGWIDRAQFGWLPESYLRMPRFVHADPVIEHEGWPGSGGANSPHKPFLPRKVLDADW